MKAKKQALFHSIVALLLCITMFVGTTFAWFTDSVSSGINMIAAGNLDVELYHSNAAVTEEQVDSATKLFLDLNGNPILWEPGVVSYENLHIANEGDLALSYQMAISSANENFVVDPTSGAQYGLSQILKVGVVEGGITATDRIGVVESVEDANWTTFADFVRSGSLLPKDKGESENTLGIVIYWEPGEYDNLWNLNNGKTLNKGEFLMIDLGIKLIATQTEYESDSFGDDYDASAKTEFFPVFTGTGSVSMPIVPNDQNQVAADVQMTAGQVSATIPAGVQLAAGTTELTMTVEQMGASGANITLGDNEAMRSLDVHVEGISADNTVPMEIYIKEAAAKGLNAGNLKLYHVENGQTVQMHEAGATPAHNQFKYDPATGDVTLYMATFSEVALVADTENAWKGEFDYSWYTNAVAPVDGEAVADYTIANADQLAAFGAIVGGMNGQTKDSFAGKTVKLISDVNLGDKESENNPDLIFYPIGYYNSTRSYEKTSGGSVTSSVSSFEGTFDGSGHTIKNFYQNTWEMFGDYNDGYSGTPNHYKDAMGLFGYVLNGTIKNLTVSNFSSDGEYTPTGVIAAYADGNSTFENIAITNCNPRVYNTGNGGIIGIAGDTSAVNDDHITLKNITVDNSNKISALWGSWDVACGGLVGMYRGNVDGNGSATGDTISFENCHVSAVIDVYNDVCANYQYYAYRYSGMIIGSVRHNTTNAEGKTIPNMTGISATGCTVNYGDWNDYYYCEFEKNTMASYSEDYQFSRVPHSELNFTDSNGNGVVDADERASVTGCKHTHTAEENHQAIYLPFHQLFTGYSWGVSSIGLEKYSGIATNLDITEGDQEESVEKFVVNLDFDESLVAGQPYEVSTLFAAIDGAEINGSAVQVSVSAMNNSGIVGTYEANTTNWTEGTLSFNKVDGMCTVTIQDYNFCKPTSFVLKDGKLYQIEKFDKKFTGNFLYRVGNQNPVPISALFTAKPDLEIGNVTVTSDKGTVDISKGWQSGTIDMKGYTGLITVTIQDDAYCMPTKLTLEVVDATNVAENGKIGNYNTTSVLLGNTSVSTLYLNGGATLYGNGFTIDCTNSPYNGTGNVSENYIIGLAGAHLDNVKVIGKVYTEYGAMASNNYNRALVISTGDSTITNCYLSNTAAPVRINGGNLTIKGSTLKGGNFANIDIRSGHLTLDNVTTINQALGNDKASDGSTVIGLGIVVYYETVNVSATSITVKNKLTQYNYVSSDDKFSNDYANQFVKAMFDSSNESLQYVNGNTTWVNSGIILMTGGINVTGAGDKKDVSFLNKNGAVYTSVPTKTDIEKPPAMYTTLGQGLVVPYAEFDHNNEEKGNYISKEPGKNDYCYYDGQKVQISMDQGDTFQYDPFILNATKLGQALNYTVNINGKAVEKGNKISFNEAGDYTITYTYEDPYNYRLGIDGEIETYSESYVKTDVVSVAIVEPEAEHAKFTFVKNSTATEEILYNNNTYISAKGVTADGKTWGKITVGNETIVYPIVDANVNKTASAECQVFYYVLKNVLSIEDANGDVYSHDKGVGIDGTMPNNLKVVKGHELKVENDVFTNYNDSNLIRTGGKIFCYSSSSQEDASVAFNDALAYKSPPGLGYNTTVTTKNPNGVRNYDAAVIVQYQFTDSNNTTYYYYVGYKITNPNEKCPSGEGKDNSSSCVTPDTLVTLADGTQKEIQYVSYQDKLLVWDFYNGTYATVPASIIWNHGDAVYRVTSLFFDDGTVVEMINSHGFFDDDVNNFVYITEENVDTFVGHKFVKVNGNSYSTVKLVDYEFEEEYTGCYSLQSSVHNNFIVENMFSITTPDYEGWFDYFNINDDMRYDTEHMKEEIAKYGLCTYDEVSYLGTYEQYVALNARYLKILIGRGIVTMDEVIEMLQKVT